MSKSTTKRKKKPAQIMNQDYDVIRSGVLSLPWEDRFVIVCRETKTVKDDCQGYGYKTRQQAIEVCNRKFGQSQPGAKPYTKISETGEQTRRHYGGSHPAPGKNVSSKKSQAAMAKWLKDHRYVWDDLKKLFLFAEQSRLVVSSNDIWEIFVQNGCLNLPFTASQFLAFWNNQNLTHASSPGY